MHTVFVLAAAKRWGEGIDLVSVADLVASAARTYDDVVTVHPLLAEGLLRAALGQPEMAEGIPEGHAVVWELVLLAALTAESGDELPALLDTAISVSAPGTPTPADSVVVNSAQRSGARL